MYETKNLNEFHFIKNIIFLLFSFLTMIFLFLSTRGLINISLLGFTICFIFLASLLIFSKNNGAVRWFNMAVSFQPSEF